MQLVYSIPILDDADAEHRTETEALKHALGEAYLLIAALRDQIQDLELDLTLCQPRIERPRGIRLRQRNYGDV